MSETYEEKLQRLKSSRDKSLNAAADNYNTEVATEKHRHSRALKTAEQRYSGRTEAINTGFKAEFDRLVLERNREKLKAEESAQRAMAEL